MVRDVLDHRLRSRDRPLPPNTDSTVERIVDLRVDDAEEPFKELRRLLNMSLGVPNRLTSQSADLAKAGKFVEAIAEQKRALEINPRSELTIAIRRQPKQWKPQAAADPIFAKMKDLPEFKRLTRP